METNYPTWLANVVMVGKANNRWHICVDFPDINIVFPKDPYHLSYIDRLIDGSSSYPILSFMDSYSRYNQMRIDPLDAPKTTFMSNHGNYYYNVMPSDHKNVDTTY